MNETDTSSETETGETEQSETETETTQAADAEQPTEESADGESASEADSSLGAGVVTIASDRTLESDSTGEAIVTGFKKEGHEVVTREHIGADHDRVQSIVSRMVERDDVDIVVTGGATSIEPDDVTIEAVEPLLKKELTSFDEVFTSLAYEVVGTRVIAARTLAGISKAKPVFCLPGNEDAARLGLDEIILPEAHHLVALAREEIDQDKWSADGPESDADEPETEQEDVPESDVNESKTEQKSDSTTGGE